MSATGLPCTVSVTGVPASTAAMSLSARRLLQHGVAHWPECLAVIVE
jgi:hypothetical protein